MPILENRAIRVSKKQLHKLKDFFGIVLRKDENEEETQKKKNHLLLPAARFSWYKRQGWGWGGNLLPSACRVLPASLLLNLPRNRGKWAGHPREVPSLDPRILSEETQPRVPQAVSHNM